MIEQISSRTVYENAWMTVREDAVRRASGQDGIYAVVDKPPSALVIPYERDGFWLVEQYRYPAGQRSWEFPMGTLPDRADGEPTHVARSELGQETGLAAGTLRHLGRFFHAPGQMSQACNVFLATDLAADPDTHERDPEEEDLIVQWFPRTEVEQMLRTGVIVDGSTIAAYTLLALDGVLVQP
ncbi:MAG TPA: NUDIX hydrolase [Actinocrinis sp.]|nr:NUDIX hydrolase [Actinocrinis sp.]